MCVGCFRIEQQQIERMWIFVRLSKAVLLQYGQLHADKSVVASAAIDLACDSDTKVLSR